MTRVYHSLIVLLVVVLIFFGLNISNQAVNSLTQESQKPLIGFKMEEESINIIALGEQYNYSRQELSQENEKIINGYQEILKSVLDYLKKIWTIFRVVFLT